MTVAAEESVFGLELREASELGALGSERYAQVDQRAVLGSLGVYRQFPARRGSCVGMVSPDGFACTPTSVSTHSRRSPTGGSSSTAKHVAAAARRGLTERVSDGRTASE